MSYFWAFHLNIGDDLAIVSTSALYTSLLVKQLFSMAKVQQLNGLMKIISVLDFIFSWCSLYSNSTIVCSLCAIYQLSKCYSITIPTMRRVFKALGVVTVDLGFTGKVAL